MRRFGRITPGDELDEEDQQRRSRRLALALGEVLDSADVTLGSVDIWLFQEGEGPRPSIDVSVLNEAERHRAQSFRKEEDRRTSLRSRVILRSVLSTYAPVAPADWIFETNRYGRPRIAGGGRDAMALRFSLAHTRGLIALGVTRSRAIGIDVEPLTAGARIHEAADCFLSTAEARHLETCHPDERHARMLELWLFKEAYAKALGLGLNMALTAVTFDCRQQGKVDLALQPAIDDLAARWIFRQFSPAPGYLLALCIEHQPCRVCNVLVRDITVQGISTRGVPTFTRKSRES